MSVAAAVCQVLTESYSSSGPYSIRTAVKAAFIQLLSVFVEKLSDVSSRLVSARCFDRFIVDVSAAAIYINIFKNSCLYLCFLIFFFSKDYRILYFLFSL